MPMTTVLRHEKSTLPEPEVGRNVALGQAINHFILFINNELLLRTYRFDTSKLYINIWDSLITIETILLWNIKVLGPPHNILTTLNQDHKLADDAVSTNDDANEGTFNDNK